MRSKTFCGLACAGSKMFQWKTLVSVTRPNDVSLNHFQYTTSSAIVALFSLLFCARSNICSVFPLALRAMTCLFQCMIALSALMGLFITLLPFFRSTIRTSGEALPSACCLTQTKVSDSNVHELKPIEAGCFRRQLLFKNGVGDCHV